MGAGKGVAGLIHDASRAAQGEPPGALRPRTLLSYREHTGAHAGERIPISDADYRIIAAAIEAGHVVNAAIACRTFSRRTSQQSPSVMMSSVRHSATNPPSCSTVATLTAQGPAGGH